MLSFSDALQKEWKNAEREYATFRHAERMLFCDYLRGRPSAPDWHIKSELARLRLRAALDRYVALERKANFNPEQPRVPKGNPDGGQWTSGGGERSETQAADAGSSSGESEAPTGDRAPLRITVYPRGGESGEGGPTLDPPRLPHPPIEYIPLEPPPAIPEERPQSERLRIRVAKQIARWVMRALLRAPLGPVGTAITIAEAALWIYEYYPLIQSYFDPPKTLKELQAGADIPKRGYETHHIVEKDSAEKGGYPWSMINAPDNKVRIPRMKHWEITGWYLKENEDFGGLTPREYLRGKDWAERSRVGLYALTRHGVLKP